MTTRFGDALRADLGPERVRTSVPLSQFTTFRVGGTADYFFEARGSADVLKAIAVARAAGVPVVVLGGGSNVLVADGGVRGLVVRVHGGDVAQISDSRIRADSGITINGLVRWTINKGLAGLEAWAGTPGTVGGAIHGNAHFQGRLIGDLVLCVRLADADGVVADVPSSEMEFAYDFSRLHGTREVVLSADFGAAPGDPTKLRAIARESLHFRKRTQPLESASAGCIFQNPDPARDRVPDGIPPSAGALVDRAGLKGARIGRASVSTTHGNFIVNEGGATADDIRALIERCKTSVRERFGVQLREEIVYLGFD